MDAEALKIRKWADSGDRTDPDASTLNPALNRSNGWPSSFSADNGDTPRRRVMNQLFRELTGLAVDTIQRGVLPWDENVDYAANALASSGSTLVRATVATGPATSNATDPATSSQTVWAPISGQLSSPAAPSAPAAAVAGDGSLFWSWRCPRDGGSQITSFTFQWRRAGTSNWTTVTTQDPFTTLTGLVNGTSYEARVLAANAQGSSAYSSTGSGRAEGTLPGGGATLGLRTDPGDRRVVLTWLEPDSGGLTITGYTVQWKSGGAAYATARQSSTTGTRLTLAGLANGTAYTFRVAAVNSKGTGPWSNESTASPAAPVVPPAPPADTAPGTPGAPEGVSRADDVVEWSWDLVTSDGGRIVTGYDFQWRYSTDEWAAGNLQQVTRTCAAVTVTGDQATVEARVRARNSVGASPWSAVGSIAQDLIMRAPTVPGAPGTPSGTPRRPLIVDWAWSAPSDSGGSDVTSYDFEWRYAGTSGWTRISNSSRTRRITVASAARGVEARVRAVNDDGGGAWSATATVASSALLPSVGPGAPRSLAASSRSALTVSWSWDAPASDGDSPITGYTLEWRRGNSGAWTAVARTASQRAAIITVPDDSMQVEARVRAVNANGDSAWSSVVAFAGSSITVGAPGVPNRPSARSGAILRGDWSWNAPVTGGSAITGYDFQWRYSMAAWSGSNIVPRTASQRTAQVSVANALRGVEGRVRAKNRGGTSSWSAGRTLAASSIRVAAPSAPSAPAASATKLRVAFTWAAPATTAGAPITGYDFQWRYSMAAWSDGNIAAVGASTLSRTVTAADGSRGVEGRVRAKNRGGTSSWSAGRTVAASALRRFTNVRAAGRDIDLAANPDSEISPGYFAVGALAIHGDTIWVSRSGQAGVVAWNRRTGQRDSGNDMTVNASAMWTGDGVTMWADLGGDNRLSRIYPVTIATSAVGAHVDGPGTGHMWSDGTTIWRVNGATVRAYVLATGARDSAKDIPITRAAGSGQGIWSDGATMWVSDQGRPAALWAYDVATRVRDSAKDIDLRSTPAPRGVVSDGETMWVATGGSSPFYLRAYS